MQNDVVTILQRLIQFDTTNPPGNEVEAIQWIKSLFDKAGIQNQIVAKSPSRPNLIARVKGSGSAAPLLLQGHVDVVTTEGQSWQTPPFDGVIKGDYLWGRGALDMKGGLAMMIAALLRIARENKLPSGDIIFAALADEEAGGEYGAAFLVDEHPDIFKGVQYALGEFGGFSIYIAGKKFYPIMIAEKQLCWMQLTLHGPAGHGSMVHRGGATAKLGKLLVELDKNLLPAHITPATKTMINGLAKGLSFPLNFLLKLILYPPLTDIILNSLGESGNVFLPLFHNTVNATIIHGGKKENVIPSTITVDLDGRLLPGFKPETMIAELSKYLPPDAELKVKLYEPGPPEPDMGMFDLLADVLKQADPTGTPSPLVLSGVTDARHFARLGIQTYGFTPMDLPANFNFTQTIHAADERIPLKSLEFGTSAIYQVIQRIGETQ